MGNNPLDEIFEKARETDVFWEETAILGFTESVAERLASLNMSRIDLARKLGTSPAFVTKLMSGKNNFTIRTMVSVARALDCKLSPIGLIPSTTNVAAGSSAEAPAEVIGFLPDNENSSIFELITHPNMDVSEPVNGICALNDYAELAVAA